MPSHSTNVARNLASYVAVMAVRVTIEARSKNAAKVVAEHLGTDDRPKSWRGLGVIRVVARDVTEAKAIGNNVSRLLETNHDLGWIRVRYDDESRVFRSNGRRTA